MDSTFRGEPLVSPGGVWLSVPVLLSGEGGLMREGGKPAPGSHPSGSHGPQLGIPSGFPILLVLLGFKMCETSRSAPVASRNYGSRAWARGFVRRSGPAGRSALSAGPFVPWPACRTSCAVRRKPRTWSSLGCWGFCSPCTVRTLWPFVASPARCDGDRPPCLGAGCSVRADPYRPARPSSSQPGSGRCFPGDSVLLLCGVCWT